MLLFLTVPGSQPLLHSLSPYVPLLIPSDKMGWGLAIFPDGGARIELENYRKVLETGT